MPTTKSTATYHGQPPSNGKPRQCEAAVSKDTATRKKGERCPNPPIRGGNVCPAHGAKAGQVKEAAQMRLARLVDPAIDVIAAIIKPQRGDKRTTDRKLMVSTAQDVLDRNGLKGKQELHVTGLNVNPADLSDDMLRQIMALKEQLSQQQGAKKAESEPTPGTGHSED